MLALIAAGLLAASPDVAGTYRIETSKVLKVKKGDMGHARVEVVPRSDAHVSPDAPISLALTTGPGEQTLSYMKNGASFDVKVSNGKVAAVPKSGGA